MNLCFDQTEVTDLKYFWDREFYTYQEVMPILVISIFCNDDPW